MTLPIIKVFVLLCFLVIAVRGPSRTRRRENSRNHVEQSFTRSNFGVNENGDIEKIPAESGDNEKTWHR
jgi:hypothetical protein